METGVASAGRYEILEPIGKGSAGVVYRARDRVTGGLVALKALNAGVSVDDRDLERLRGQFLNEAHGAELLAHPGIAAIYDLVDEPGAGDIYLAMEYVEGESLRAILRRPDPLPFDFVVDVVSQVAEVLDHVHAQGVVHRDIKPENIVVTPSGRIKVTDFGIAQLAGRGLDRELERTGSPAYLAPERLVGGGDYRVDIYALGVVLYELLTRQLPFRAETLPELVHSIAHDDPAPPDRHAPELPPGLRRVLARALAKDPAERYRYAGELVAAVKEIQRAEARMTQTVPALPVLSAVPESPDGWEAAARRLGGRLGAAAGRAREAARALSGPRRRALLGLLAGGLAGVALVSLATRSRPGTAAEAAPARSEPAPARSEAAPAPGEAVEYLAVLREVRGLLERGQAVAAAGLLDWAATTWPEREQIDDLRAEARRLAEQERASLLTLDVAALVGAGEAELAEGRVEAAAQTSSRALALDPNAAGARALAAAIDAERARRRRVARAEEAETSKPPPEPAPEPEPAPLVIEPIRPPPSTALAAWADLRIDVFSQRPRGVLTLYAGDAQVLRRPFHFEEKVGFMRSRDLVGGFDEQIRLAAGRVELRVYLALPGEQTRLHRLEGVLPPGGIRTLRVRVSEAGELEVGLH